MAAYFQHQNLICLQRADSYADRTIFGRADHLHFCSLASTRPPLDGIIHILIVQDTCLKQRRSRVRSSNSQLFAAALPGAACQLLRHRTFSELPLRPSQPSWLPATRMLEINLTKAASAHPPAAAHLRWCLHGQEPARQYPPTRPFLHPAQSWQLCLPTNVQPSWYSLEL